MQANELQALKKALIDSGYSSATAKKIIDVYTHADLKCVI
jgi:hypothetical protein